MSTVTYSTHSHSTKDTPLKTLDVKTKYNGNESSDVIPINHTSHWTDSYVIVDNRERPNENNEDKQSGFKLFVAMSRRQRGILFLTTLAMFLSDFAFALLGPIFPAEALKKGMDIGTVGFVYGLYQAVIFITSPFFGSYLAKLGPKFVFFGGIFLGGSCNLFFGSLLYCPGGALFIVLSIVIRCVEAVGFSGFITSNFAIVSSEFKENAGFTFGVLQTGSGLGYLMGPIIGGALYELGGFSLPFYVAGVAVFLNGIGIYMFLPDVGELSMTRREGSMLGIIRNPIVAVAACCALTGAGGISTFDALYSRRLEPMNMSEGIIGLVYGLVALLYSITSTVWGYISDAENFQAPLIVMGQLVFGIGFLMIGPSVLLPFIPFNLTSAFIGLSCIGVSFGCTLIPTMKCMVIGATEMGLENNLDTYALVSGFFTSVKTFGAFIGPIGVGYLTQEFGFRVAYTVPGMCSIFMAVVSFVVFKFRNHQRNSYVTISEQA